MRLRSLIAPVLTVVIVGAVALALAGSNGSSGSAPASKAATGGVKAGKVMVAIQNYAYAPPAVTVKAGAHVTFVNHDQTAHTATANQGGFDTGTLNAGASKTVDFKRPGTYAYHCSFHAFMNATIKVVP